MKYISTILIMLAGVLNAHAHVNLTYPTGGETFTAGDTVNITWQIAINHTTQNWDLFFSSDGGTTFDTLALNINADSLHYSWVVPHISTTQAQIKVVMDNVGTDYSDISGNFTIDNTVGIKELEKSPNFSVFPNPTKNIVYIKFNQLLPSNTKMVVADETGRVIKEITIASYSIADRLQIDVSHWNAGIYWLAVESKSGLVTKKILKE